MKRNKYFLLVFLLVVSLILLMQCSTVLRQTNQQKSPENAETPNPQKAPPPEGYQPKKPSVRREGIEKECVDSSRIDFDEICYDLLDPVCGCDSITYSNDCQARKSGVLKWRKGACK